ncbi:MAG TPA: ATP-binding protein [Steroidobacteraceae bacterium]|nr:ATP-binding protein [Steroidobacteraceae bacterium]
MSAIASETQDEQARILIVEDERIVALNLADTLGELGYTVAGVATEGEEAIDRARQADPNLILMDVHLSGTLDGIRTAEIIRQQRDVPIIYLTAHSDGDTLRRAAESSPSGYLVKPFKSPELRCAIEIALYKHALDARMRDREQWLATTLQSIADAVVATDPDRTIRLFNQAAEALTGWDREDAIGRDIDSVLAFVDESTGQQVSSLIGRALERKDAISSTQAYSLVARDGSLISVSESAAPIVDSFGRVLGSVLILSDTREQRRRMEEIRKLNEELEDRVHERTAALAAANRELEAFSYSVAHDLRAPLRSLDGFTQLLQDHCGPQLDETGIDYLQRIQGATARMGQLIDAMLTLSRIGRTEIRAMQIDLTEMANHIAQEIGSAHAQRRVDVIIAPNMRAFGDPRLLRVALSNLLDNAWKFTSPREAATIEVGTLTQGKAPVYFVRDNGAGFDPNYASKLFSAFQRLHSERDFPGTGIGLAIVQRVIALHGGTIWAESQPQQGATFYFTLPKAFH